MKLLKQAVKLILPTLGAFLLLGAYSGTNNLSSALYQEGLSTVSVMEEMAENEDWVNLFSSNQNLTSLLSAVGDGDYSRPKAVYQIRLSDETVSHLTRNADLEAFSDTLQAYLRATVQSSIAAQINAKGGADALAAASACTASRIFFCDDLHENLLYLYTYENAAPAMISFLVGEDGAVSATGLFILYDGFPTGSAAEIQQFLSSLNVEVTEVSVPA